MENLPIPRDEEEDISLPVPTEDSSFSDFYEAHQLQRRPRKAMRREKVVRHYDDAFELIGGVPRLAYWAHSDPKEFYKQYAKLIPSEQKTQFDGLVRVIGFVQPTALDGAIEGETE
jgi:hypothetical protein